MSHARLFDPERPEPYRGPWQPFPDSVADDPQLTDSDKLLYIAIQRFHSLHPGEPADNVEIARMWGHRLGCFNPAIFRLVQGGHVSYVTDLATREQTILPTALIDRRYRDRAEWEVVKARDAKERGRG